MTTVQEQRLRELIGESEEVNYMLAVFVEGHFRKLVKQSKANRIKTREAIVTFVKQLLEEKKP